MASALLDTPVAIRPRQADVRSAAAALEGAPAEEVVAWAVDRFGSGLVLASSFQDCVLLDIALGVAPALEVVFLDTQYHFPEPLDRALSGRSAWMSGLRRADSATRSDTPVVGVDERRGLVKVNPLAAWSDAEVERYVVEHGLPVGGRREDRVRTPPLIPGTLGT